MYRFSYVPIVFVCRLKAAQLKEQQGKIPSIDVVDAIMSKRHIVSYKWIESLAEKPITTGIPSCSSYAPTLTLQGVFVKVVESESRANCLSGYTFLLESSGKLRATIEGHFRECGKITRLSISKDYQSGLNGQNDLSGGFQTLKKQQLHAAIPDIINEFANSVQKAIHGLEFVNRVLARYAKLFMTTKVIYNPSKLAALFVYALRCTLHRTLAWTYIVLYPQASHTVLEDQVRDFSKTKVKLHAFASGSKFKAIYKKYVVLKKLNTCSNGE
ncbi:BRCT domain-containing protein [Artemisia annua]|uniref:BRCT domain-containing protein n=1 Tax=Artemisia annua TaxID=35608 RepID=A0A2U1NY13_ARTAN|nr:BRCT domain-containing protein [Artemisia annua]